MESRRRCVVSLKVIPLENGTRTEVVIPTARGRFTARD